MGKRVIAKKDARSGMQDKNAGFSAFLKYVLKSAFVAVAVAMLIELVFFNYYALESRSFSAISPLSEVEIGPDESEGVGAAVEYVFEAASVQNIRIDNRSERSLDLRIQIKDEGNAVYYDIGTITVRTTEIVRIHPYGNLLGIKIVSDTNEPLLIEASFNQVEPLELSGQRIAFFSAVVLFALLIGFQSPIRTISYRDRRFLISLGIVSTALMPALVLYAYNPDTFTYSNYAHHHQYHELAVALSEGHVWLNQVPSRELMAMENPYDTGLRSALGVEYLWDHAYYDGKYYVYFGVLPVLLFHMPYYLLTGQELHNAVAVAISLSFFSAGLVLLLKAIMDRWFSGSTAFHFMVCYSIMFLSSWALRCSGAPYLYNVPISLALALVVWGLFLWLAASKNGRVNLLLGMAGSFLIALVMLCRPQFLVFAAFGIVIACELFKEHVVSKKRTAVKVASLLVPFVAIGIVAGVYNYARFGNALDFGANYNLTTNDMTHRGFELARIPLGLYCYLFQPPSINFDSPVIDYVSVASNYYGNTIAEGMTGGSFAFLPILWLVLALPFIKDSRFRIPKTMALLSMVLAGVVVVFDTNGAGVVSRYHCDYGLLLGISASIAFLMVVSVYSKQTDRVVSVSTTGHSSTCLYMKIIEGYTVIFLTFSLAAALLASWTFVF